jgi:hypothetical protein
MNEEPRLTRLEIVALTLSILANVAMLIIFWRSMKEK